MTLKEARKILGLGPDEDPRPHLSEFKAARERIAEMVRSAPNETLGDRYQVGLVEFDQALAAVRESLETPSEPTPAEPPAKPAEKAAPEPEPVIVDLDDFDKKPRFFRRVLAVFLWLLVFLTIGAGGAWIYFKNEESKVFQRQARIAYLEREGSVFVENRRWQEAAKSFAEIERLAPGSDLAKLGRRSIESGMTEEQTQFVGYWTGQAIAELDAGRLDEAETAAKRVLEKFPTEKEASSILERISSARAGQSKEKAIAAARKLLEDHQWEKAIVSAKRILTTSPEDSDAKSIATDATAALDKIATDQAKAKDLLEKAIARDQGQFDQQALDWLREAAVLAPDNTEITSRLEKMASYTRTLRVPGDFATPAEALAAARDRDRIVLTEQTWQGPLVINAAIELQGAGSAKTIVECPAGDGSAITIGPDAKGARISGIAFRHESFLAVGTDRFSAALVRGGGATFVECKFSDASGHGLAVIENGEVVANRCRFSDNGWNGAAAIGKGCMLEIRDSESINNFEHGIESWDGAGVTLVNNRCEGNSRNGIHADNRTAAATIEGNQLIANREFGLVLDSAGSGKVSGNTARGNLLGGYVVRTAAASLPFSGNQATLNQGPGLVLEKGLSQASYTENTLLKNASREVFPDADLSNQDANAGVSPKQPLR
jgi:parallel beta-helix repeat protein